MKGPDLEVDKHHFSGFGVRYATISRKKQRNLKNHTLSCQSIPQVAVEAVQFFILIFGLQWITCKVNTFQITRLAIFSHLQIKLLLQAFFSRTSVYLFSMIFQLLFLRMYCASFYNTKLFMFFGILSPLGLLPIYLLNPPDAFDILTVIDTGSLSLANNFCPMHIIKILSPLGCWKF